LLDPDSGKLFLFSYSHHSILYLRLTFSNFLSSTMQTASQSYRLIWMLVASLHLYLPHALETVGAGFTITLNFYIQIFHGEIAVSNELRPKFYVRM